MVVKKGDILKKQFSFTNRQGTTAYSALFKNSTLSFKLNLILVEIDLPKIWGLSFSVVNHLIWGKKKIKATPSSSPKNLKKKSFYTKD